MRVLIIVAAFTFAALTPYLGALPRSGADLAELLDEEGVSSAADAVEEEAQD